LINEHSQFIVGSCRTW